MDFSSEIMLKLLSVVYTWLNTGSKQHGYNDKLLFYNIYFCLPLFIDSRNSRVTVNRDWTKRVVLNLIPYVKVKEKGRDNLLAEF